MPSGVRALQEPDGCFTAAKQGNESDMRFVYCAACICFILDDWSGMDVERSINYILNSIVSIIFIYYIVLLRSFVQDYLWVVTVFDNHLGQIKKCMFDNLLTYCSFYLHIYIHITQYMKVM